MKVPAALVVLLAAAACCSAQTDAPTFKLPGDFRVRVEVVAGEQPPAAAWDKFLSRWFALFDRDSSGRLDRDEAARLPPFPLPGKRELAFDFARLDSDGGGVTPAEFSRYCRRGGSAAVIGVVAGPADSDLRLSALFCRRLDADRDGKFSASELRNIAAALQPFDFNEDETLELAELLDNAPPAAAPAAEQARAVKTDGEESPYVLLRAPISGQAPQIVLTPAGGMELLNRGSEALGRCRYRGPEGRWLLSVEPLRIWPSMRSAADFLAAQYDSAVGNRRDLPLAIIRQSGELSGLGALGPLADRNGDERLSPAELREYAGLIAEAIDAQIWVTLTDREHNLFPALDADGDGRLGYLELMGAGELLAKGAAADELPRQFQLSFGAAPVRLLGGMVIPQPAKRKALPSKPEATKGPRWFEVLDKNRDAILSPREFLGPPAVFKALDTDSDGAISRAEAAAQSLTTP